MPVLSRKAILFILLDGLLVLGLVGVFFGVRRLLAPSQNPLSERILVTPGPGADPTHGASDPGKDAAKEEAEPEDQGIVLAGEGDRIDLKRIRAKDLAVTIHRVVMGENYWTIANDNNVTINTLLGANPDMPFKANIDQQLVILSRKGVLHTVEKGETPSSIAALYKVEERTVRAENGVTWWKGLRQGDVLFIPDVKPIRMVKEWKDYFSKRGFFGIPFAGWGKGWTSGFGYRTDPITGESRLHKGMDFKAKYGESVYAAASGRVIFAGISGGYGNLIQIRHSNGYLTYYGHLSKILTKQGKRVRRGELIGKVGATGRVTGPHLHFEIRKNGKAINPLPLI